MESHQDDQTMQYKMYKERLRELGLLSFKKKMLKEDITAVISYIMRQSTEGRVRLLRRSTLTGWKKTDIETQKIQGRYWEVFFPS